MLLGAHESVAGGLHLALKRGTVDGCRAVQLFTKNSNQWREPAVTEEQIAAFKEAHAGFGAAPLMAHTSYLINLASGDPEILRKSHDALVAEVQRCSALGVAYVVLHPGAHNGVGDEEGLRRVVASLDEVHARTAGASAKILLENTAGQGTCVGHVFEHLALVFEQVKAPERLGICLDTQHAFAAGYDLSSPEGYDNTFAELGRRVGVDKVRAFHLNDSKKPLGSRVDRHEHIGEGNLGLYTFWRLANDARFADLPGVVETEPRDKETPYRDEVLLLQGLVGAPEPARKPAFQLEVQETPKPAARPRAAKVNAK